MTQPAPLESVRIVASRRTSRIRAFARAAWDRTYALATLGRVAPFVVALAASAIALFASHGRSTPYNNYTLLADAIAHGRLWINWPGDSVSDALEWAGHRYVIEAPVPALLMLPSVLAFGTAANQTQLAIVLCGVAMGFATSLLQRLGVNGWSLVWLLAFAFCGTDLLWCAELGDVWFLAHVSAVCFTFVALWELTGKTRPWLVALCVLGAVESRFSLIATVPFYVAALACGGLRFERMISWRRVRPFAIVFALAALVVVWYDYARWGLPNDIGYTEFFHRDSWGQKDGSPFRFSYLPYEFYSFFIRGPVYVEWRQQVQWPMFNVDMNGIALTFTSPALLFAFWAREPRRAVIALWCATILAALPNFLYYLNGWYQFGMRHALDFEPFMLLLMAFAARKGMPRWAVALCAYSSAVGVWGVWWWNAYVRSGS